MGRGWRRMMLFGRGERESKAPSENNGGASISPTTPRNRDRVSPLKLSFFSAFRTSPNTTTTVPSSTIKESNSGSKPPSPLLESERGSETREILLEWEDPSPVRKWRSRTPPPLSKLKKSFSSLFQSSSYSSSSSSSTPSSPKSPSPLSLFKSSLLSTRSSRCEKCGETMKRIMQGTRKEGERGCSVCSSPPSSSSHEFHKQSLPQEEEVQARKPALNYKSYNDDEPLSLSSNRASTHHSHHSGTRTPTATFNPIPEADEEEEEESDDDLSIVSSTSTSNNAKRSNNISISVKPEAALVSSGRRQTSYVVAVRVRAPAARSASSETNRRAPMDLVTVLEISPEMAAEKLETLKRTIRPIIASMGPADRLSIVAFSGGTMTKRLLPLRRMTKQGQRAARQIVDRLVVCSAASQQGDQVAAVKSASDALMKAKRVLEDRRECNPVATIMLLSDKHLEQQQQCINNNNHENIVLEKEEEKEEDALTRCIGGLVSVAVMQDVRLQFVLPSGEGEVTAIYRYALNESSTAFSGTGGGTGSSISLGELHAGEEVELLLELRVPLNQHRRRHSLSFCVKCTYRDPVTLTVSSGVEQPPLFLPPVPVQNSSMRLHNLFIAFRAVVESRRLVGLNDFATAHHLLYSARSVLLQCAPAMVQDLIPTVEAELVEIQRRRGIHQREWEVPIGREPLTPTSAWRAAEQLAKVAIMRKSQKRVSDLHGFENAWF